MKISRMLVSNFGHGDARYKGNLFDLAPDGDPLATLVSQANGHGKTTAIGAVLAIFEPRVERFVQHLRNREARFHEYLPRKGVAVVAMELVGAPDLIGTRPTLVVGYFAGFRPGTSEIRRTFFGFAPKGDLAFASMPFEPLRGADQGRVETYEGIAEWCRANAGERSDPYDGIYWTTVQGDWLEYLTRRGVPVEQIAYQSRFASTEGGIDKMLKFQDHNFIETLSRLVGLGNAVLKEREAVIEAARRSRERPLAEIRLKAIEGLKVSLSTLAVAAADERAAMETVASVRAQEQGRTDRLFALSDALASRRSDAEAAAARFDAERRSSEAEVVAMRREAALGSLGISRIALAALRAEEAEADRSIGTEDARIAAASIETRRREVVRTAAAVAAARSRLDEAGASLEAFMEPLRRAGSAVRAAARRDAEAADLRLADIAEEQLEATVRRSALQERGNALAAERAVLTQALKLSDAMADRLRRIVDGHVASGIMSPGDVLADAAAGAARAAEDADAALTSLEAELSASRSRVQALRHDRDAADEEARRSAEGIQTSVRAVAEREALLRSVETARVATGAFDLEDDALSEGFEGRLTEAVSLARRLQRAAEAAEAAAREESDVLSRGVAFVEPSVRAAIARLGEAGLSSVPALERIRAVVGHDPDAAWARLDADPALASTVHVERRDDVARAVVALRADRSGIVLPVRVGFYDPDDASEAAVSAFETIRPERDDAYAGPSQPERLAAARRALDEAERDLASRSARVAALDALAGLVSVALADERRIPLGGLVAHRDGLEAEAVASAARGAVLGRDLVEATGAAEALGRRVAETRTALATARRLASTLAQDASRAETFAAQVMTHDARVASEVRLAAVVDGIEGLDDERVDCDRRYDAVVASAEAVRRERAEALRIAASVAVHDGNVGADPGADDVATLFDAYSRRLEVFEERRDGTVRDAGRLLADASGRHETAERALRTAEASFAGTASALAAASAEAAALGGDEAVADWSRAAEGRRLALAETRGGLRSSIETARAETDRLLSGVVGLGLDAASADAALDDPRFARADACRVAMRAAEATVRLRAEDAAKAAAAADGRRAEATRLGAAVEELANHYLDGRARVDASATPAREAPASWREERRRLGRLREEADASLRASSKAASEALREVRTFAKVEMPAILQDGGTSVDVEIGHAMERLGTLAEPELKVDAPNALRAIDGFVASLRQKLDESVRWEVIAVSRLAEAGQTIVATLEKATRVRMGEGPFTDRNILRYGNSFPELRRAVEPAAKAYFRRIVDDHGDAGKDEHQFVDRFFRQTVRSSGQREDEPFRILKVVVQSPEATWVDVEKLVASGGQELTAAVLLYLVAIRLSQDVSARGPDRGMFLIMDNSFGQANSKELVDTQVGLAESLGVQIVVFSGIRDRALDSFPIVYCAWAQGGRVTTRRATDAELGRIAA